MIAITPFLELSLALASVAPPASADYGNAEHIVVQLSSFKFAPAAIHLKAGRPIILHLVNTSGVSHDFTASDFFAAATVRSGDAHRITNGIISLGGKQEVLIALTPSAGRFSVRCSHTFHKALGMRGEVIVSR